MIKKQHLIVSGNVFYFDSCALTTPDLTIESSSIGDNLFYANVGNAKILTFSSTDTNVSTKGFDITNGDFINDNNVIGSSLYDGTTGNVRSLRTNIKNSTIGANLFSVVSGVFNNLHLDISNNISSTKVGFKVFDLSNGFLRNTIMNVNDVDAGSSYCNVDVTSPIIDFSDSKFGGALFRVENGIFEYF